MRCPECHNLIPPDTHTQGLCPRCLLTRALASPGKNPQATTLLPSMTEIAAELSQFELLEFLGQGGMGAVYKARQRSLNRLVALKIFTLDSNQDPAFLERFAHEARVLASLNHPSIVGAYEFCTSPSFAVLVMEYVPGPNLRSMMLNGPLPPKTALAIAASIAEALVHAHSSGIIHRDIKPENILIHPDAPTPEPDLNTARIRVADFGLAKFLYPAFDELVPLTAPQDRVGTAVYLAPEQLRSDTPIDARADLYSLSVVLYELLTGELPIGRFPPPSAKVAIPRRLDRLILSCLNPDPNRRCPDAATFLHELHASTVNRLPVAILAAIVILIAGATISTMAYLASHRQPESPPPLAVDTAAEHSVRAPTTKADAVKPATAATTVATTKRRPVDSPIFIHDPVSDRVAYMRDPLAPEKLEAIHGADRVVKIYIDNLPGDVTSFISHRLSQIAGGGDQIIRVSATSLTAHQAPVTDLQAFADKIDFGTVTSVDPATRTIRVKADPARLPEAIPWACKDPTDPNFYMLNAKELTNKEARRRLEAARRLKTAKPPTTGEPRDQIIRALSDLLDDPDAEMRVASLEALVAWSPPNIYDLVQWSLSDKDKTVRRKAIESLGKLHDPRAITNLTALLATDRFEASNALKSIGSPAESAVIAQLSSTDTNVQLEAIRILKVIGTEKSIAPLQTLNSGAARHTAQDALTTIERRLPAATNPRSN